MGDNTKIEWTRVPGVTKGATWNVTTGCTKISAGCKYCYAERNWNRLSANSKTVYYGREFTDIQCHQERLLTPLQWTQHRGIFVNSMSDLFHPDVPFGFIDQVFAVMALAYWHTFLILTKRPQRMKEYFSDLPARTAAIAQCELEIYEAYNGKLPTGAYLGPAYRELPLANVWLGTSVEDQATANERILPLLQTPAAIRFLSAEPLLGPVNLEGLQTDGIAFSALASGNLVEERLDWVIVGGESGHHARPMAVNWALYISRQCRDNETHFFFKQGSQANWLDFRNPDTYPPQLRVKEFPR